MLFLLVLLLNTCLLINANGSLFSANDEQIKAHWSIFKANHGFHKLSSHEETTRFKLFKDNYHKVLEHNQEAVIFLVLKFSFDKLYFIIYFLKQG